MRAHARTRARERTHVHAPRSLQGICGFLFVGLWFVVVMIGSLAHNNDPKSWSAAARPHSWCDAARMHTRACTHTYAHAQTRTHEPRSRADGGTRARTHARIRTRTPGDSEVRSVPVLLKQGAACYINARLKAGVSDATQVRSPQHHDGVPDHLLDGPLARHSVTIHSSQ